jgi:NACalpha-BTF3-like transcription factor
VAYLSEQEIYTAYQEASDEADQWRIDYPQYERLADNGLLDDLDENLPEVNDGSLAASLFKLAKRVIRKKMSGRAIALDRDDQWLTELANIYWTKKILPNAKSKASPRRKWKDAVRKSAIFGGQPIITLFVTRGSYTGSDFIVPYAQDVKLEAGKDSDEDSDVIFWDVYYSKLQVRRMIEQAKQENADDAQAQKDYAANKAAHDQAKLLNPEMGEFEEQQPEAYNKWDIPALEAILKSDAEEQRPGNQAPKQEQGSSGVKKTGYKFFIGFQRGVAAPFMMCHPGTNKCVREWSNPDPTGDVPVHYLYCYQDFVNPYGIGIVKLAGGTQNVLDYMRQADILATQLGLRPPKQIKGDEDQVDEDSLVYAQDANWYVGNASVERMEMASGVYSQLPGRMSMYKNSLQQMIPMGDTTLAAGDAGDPTTSKTPAGVKLQAANLSIDDEDFAENVDETYAAVGKSMINTQFANMQGSDLLKLNDDEREVLTKAGLEFPQTEDGQVSNELEVVWDNARAMFDFEIDPDADKTDDEKAALDGKLKAYELVQADPNIDQYLSIGGKRLDRGELLSEIFSQLTENDKIIVDITPEEKAQIDAMSAQRAAQAGGQVDPATGQPMAPPQPGMADPNAAMQPGAMPPQQPGMESALAPEGADQAGELTDEEAEAGEHIQMVMQQYGVDENTAAAMLEAERQGFEPQEIIDYLKGGQPQLEPANA